MTAEILNQSYTFFVFIVNGILIGILFDFFRILRKSFSTKDWITYLEDILFWILTGVLLLYFIFVFNNGSLRMYLFFAIAIGITCYMFFCSKKVIHVSVSIIGFMKKMIQKMIHVLIYPFQLFYQILKRIFISPISFIFINFRNFTSKKIHLCSKKIKNILFFKKKEGKQA